MATPPGGRRRDAVCEIARSFGEDLDADEPMTEQDASDELGRRFGPGPHWVIADHDDVFVELSQSYV